LQALDEVEIDERLSYLERQLDDGRTHATLWHRGWVGFYLLGMVVQSVRAGLEDDAGKRADLIVSAVKAPGGAFNLLWSGLRAQEGADPVRALPAASRDDRLRRLAHAEALMLQDAEEAGRRWSWKRHAANVAVNSAGALIVWLGFDERTRAWRSAGIGMAVGEVMIWSQPWEAPGELKEYERRFDVTVEPQKVGWSWDVVPTGNGAAIEVAF
jgi:hypothetical protein